MFQSVRLDRFMLVRHKDRGWELPGGHVEPGENPLEGAKREWAEETGMSLALVQAVARHVRPDGSVGEFFLGSVNEEPQGEHAEEAGESVETAGPVDPRGRIVDQRWVRRLQECSPLGFPGDPYRELAQAVISHVHRGPWRLPNGEDADGFIARISDHPQASPRGDPVETLLSGK